MLHIAIYHFAWEDQSELQGNICYNALCTGQYLDIAQESGYRGQYPDIARESGFHLSFEPLFDPNNVETKDIAIYIVHLIMFTCGIGFLILNQP